MTDLTWIKLSINIFDDEKIKYLRTLPEGDQLILIWIELLVRAGKKNDQGFIYLTRKMPYNPETFASEIDRNPNIVRAAFKLFDELEMIEVMENGYILISNWAKHQSLDKLEKRKEADKLRQQKRREKLKEQTDVPKLAEGQSEQGEQDCLSRDNHVTCHGDVTPCHGVEEEEEKEKNKEYRIEEEQSHADDLPEEKSFPIPSFSDPIREMFTLLQNAGFKNLKTSETIISLSSWISLIGYEEVKLSIIDAMNKDKKDSLGYLQSIINRKISEKNDKEITKKPSEKYDHFYL